jgi:hypothetical protein
MGLGPGVPDPPVSTLVLPVPDSRHRRGESYAVNKRRLQIVVSAAIAVAATVYAISLLVPVYNAYSQEHFDRLAGWGDERVRQSAIDACSESCKAQPRTGPFPNEDLSACDRMCLQPPVDPWRHRLPAWWETPVGFLRTVWPNALEYSLIGIPGSWFVGLLLVRALPAGVSKVRLWLRTPSDIQ